MELCSGIGLGFLVMVTCDNIFQLRFNSHYDYIKECCFLGQFMGKKNLFSKCQLMEVRSGILLELFIVLGIQLVGWLTKSEYVYSIGLNC
jgi:hypothetical protein